MQILESWTTTCVHQPMEEFLTQMLLHLTKRCSIHSCIPERTGVSTKTAAPPQDIKLHFEKIAVRASMLHQRMHILFLSFRKYPSIIVSSNPVLAILPLSHSPQVRHVKRSLEQDSPPRKCTTHHHQRSKGYMCGKGYNAVPSHVEGWENAQRVCT